MVGNCGIAGESLLLLCNRLFPVHALFILRRERSHSAYVIATNVLSSLFHHTLRGLGMRLDLLEVYENEGGRPYRVRKSHKGGKGER